MGQSLIDPSCCKAASLVLIGGIMTAMSLVTCGCLVSASMTGTAEDRKFSEACRHVLVRLHQFEESAATMTAEALIDSFELARQSGGDADSDAEKFFRTEKNGLIEMELGRRGEAVRASLVRFKDDPRHVYTGGFVSVGKVCRNLRLRLDLVANGKNPEKEGWTWYLYSGPLPQR